jgi:HEAT repeat protein
MDKRKGVLLTALKDNEEDVRRTAAEALEKYEIRQRLDFLSMKIEKGEMLEKIRAIYALSDLKGQRVVAILLHALKDLSEDVKAAALRVLGTIADKNALPQIVETLKDSSPTVVRVAVEALSRYNDPRVLGYLMQMLKNTDPGVVEKALEVIAFLGDKRAEEAMVHFALKGNARMRKIALKALGEMES